MFSHQIKNYNSRIFLTFALNSSFKITFKSLIVFKLLLFILLFLSWLMFILPSQKKSCTSNVDNNQLAMVAMFLDFIVVISPLISFKIGVCTLMKVFIALIRSWETTPMDNPSKSLREGVRQGDEVKVTSVPSMRFVIFFKIVQPTCSFMTFNCPKLHHIATLPILILLHWNCPKGDT